MPWLTPDTVGALRAYRVSLPDALAVDAVFLGQLLEMEQSRNWEQHGTMTPDEIALEIANANETNFPLRLAMPIGSVVLYAGGTLPDGFLWCDGASYDTTDYSLLFDAIGYLFGGAGANFNVPDISELFPIGVGGSLSLADIGGENEHTLTVDEVPGHDHSIHSHLVGLAQLGAGSVVDTPGLGGNTGGAGGGMAHNNMPPYIAMNFIICYR